MKNKIKLFGIIVFITMMIFSMSACDDSSGNDNNNENNTFNTLVEFLTSLQTTAKSGGNYTYEVKADENIIPQNLNYDGKNNITIVLKGNNANRTISLSTTGAMFTVRSGVTLILESNLILRGLASNNQPLVVIAADAMLIINDGIIITGNNNTSSTGGGVVISSAFSAFGQNEGGKFIMNGGEISNNKAIGGGGGIAVSSGASFTMNNGKISNNTASISSTVNTVSGGGVLMYGNFIMEDGQISNNLIAANSLSNVVEIYGGGVSVVQSNFTMKGGRIIGNTASSSNSMSAGYGGGVHVSGVSGYPGSFTMQGGEISGNTISANLISRGGGVHVGTSTVNNLNFSSFIKTGGIVTGYADNPTTGNVAKNSSGTIQNNQGNTVYASDPVRRRETTAGVSINLNSSIAGVTGGWEN